MTTLEEDIFNIVNNQDLPEEIREAVKTLWATACKYETLLLQLRDMSEDFDEL